MGDKHIVVVEPKDNVATAIRDVEAGELVDIDPGGNIITVEIEEKIPFGHKIALKDIEDGDVIYKYGLSIGYASQDISTGEWVHTHNVDSNYGRGDLEENTEMTVSD